MTSTEPVERRAVGRDSGAGGPKAFDRLLPLLLAGYVLLDRGFAWFHVPGTPIFVGEIVLAFGLAGAARTMGRALLWRRSSVVFLIVLYLGWGLVRTVPGLFADPVSALRDGALWFYAIVAFAVLWALLDRPATLGRWVGAYYRLILPMVLWVPMTVFVSDQISGIDVPDSDVSLLSYKPGNAAVHLLTAIGFMWLVLEPASSGERRRRNTLTFLAIAAILVVGTQTRGGFVAALLAGTVLLLYPLHRTRLVLTGAASMLLLALALVVVDPEFDIQGRDVSGEQLASNVTSIVTGEGEGELGGNIQWRLHHWGRVWEGTHEDVPLVGHGFGPNLAEIYHIPQADIGLRNAHNSHLSVLARSGWVGATIWLGLWGFWFWETHRARRRLLFAGHRRLAGLAAWSIVAVTAIHLNAIFDPTLEGPQVAFWLWSLCALGIFLVVVSRPREGRQQGGTVMAGEVDAGLGRALGPRL